MEKSEQTESPDGRTVVGRGRLGGSIRRALESRGLDVTGVGRGFDPESLVGEVVLICVPDDEIVAVVERIGASGVRPRLVGHTSGATGLDVLGPIRSEDGVFSLHPLQTVPDDETDLRGAPAAVAGSGDRATAAARELAESLGMVPFEVGEEMRALYHAAASIASNFLITLEQEAAVMLERAGVEEPRRVLTPLVRRSLENWIERGPDALTGPVARGDRETVESHRLAIGLHAPEMLDLYDALVSRTESLARGKVSG